MRKALFVLFLSLFIGTVTFHGAMYADGGNFLNDSFTDTAGTVLSSHTGELGATWTRHAASSSGSVVISAGTRIRSNATGDSTYYASGTATSADYTVTGVMAIPTDFPTTGSTTIGMWARLSTASPYTGYFLKYSGSAATRSISLLKYVSGAATTLSTISNLTLAAGDSYTFTWNLTGTSQTVTIQRASDSDYLTNAGAWQSTSITAITATDASITTAGRVGINFFAANGTDTQYPQWDSITATNPSTATAYTISGPTASIVSTASNNFTITPNGTYTGTITPSDNAAGGTFSPTSLTFSGSDGPQTFTYTPSTTGLKTLSTSNNGGLTDPSSISFTSLSTSTVVYDTFTGTTGTNLSTHTGEVGATWTGHPSGTGSIVISSGSRIKSNNASDSTYYASGIPTSADYTVTGKIYIASDYTTPTNSLGFWARLSTTSPYNGYFLRYSAVTTGANQIVLSKYVSGTATGLVTINNVAISAGDTLILNWTLSGTSQVITIQRASDNEYLTTSGGWQVAATNAITTTDSSITGVGRAAVFFHASNGTDAQFPQIDSIAVTNPTPATAYTLTGPTAGLTGSASTNFTVTPNGTFTGTITPSDNGVGGTFSPTSLTFSNSSVAQTFTYTPSSGSTVTISTTNNGSLSDPASLSYASLSALTFLDDTFTDTAGTVLSSHTGEVGATWTRHPASPSGSVVISAGSRIKSNATGDSTYYASGTANSADYTVVGKLYVASDYDSTSNAVGLWARLSSTSPYNGYFLSYRGYTDALTLSKFVSGTATTFNTLNIVLGSNDTYTFTWNLSGPNQTVTIQRTSDGDYLTSGGQWQSGAATVFSVTDSSITTAGTVAVNFNKANGTDSQYPQWDSVMATNTSVASAYTLTGPASGYANIVSNNFTVTPNGLYTGTVTITPSGGGLSTPIVLTFNNTSGAQTFTITPTSTGTVTLTPTNNGSLTNPSTLSYTAGATPFSVMVTDSNLYFSKGNWYVNGSNYAATNYRGAYLKTAFTGTTASVDVDVSREIAAGATSGDYPWVRWIVDGGTPQDMQLTSSTSQISVANGLAAGTHTLDLYVFSTSSFFERWAPTNGFPPNSLVITGLTLDNGATTVARNDLLPKTTWFYGDSITEGDGVYGSGSGNTGTPPNNDSTKTWVWPVARALNSEATVIGWGGQGWSSSGAGGVPSFVTTWNYLFNGQARDFSTPPDNVVINMGTNATVASGVVKTWLGSLRAAIGPTAKVFLLIPFKQTNAAVITSDYNSYQASTPDSNMRLINLGTDGVNFSTNTSLYSYDGTHPNAAGHALLGNALTPAVLPTAYAVTGPTSGALTDTPAFTVTLNDSATFTGNQSITVTATDGIVTATSGGTITNNASSAVTVQPAVNASSFTFTYAPASEGAKTITFSNGQTGWVDPSAISYTVQAAPATNTNTSPLSTVGTVSGGGGPTWNPPTAATPSVAACLPGDNFNAATGLPCPKSTAPTFTKNLYQGIRDTQVQLLQQYLNAQGFIVAASGAGSIGKETTYFGPATKAALGKFQKAHGIFPTNGYFGPITRTYIAVH